MSKITIRELKEWFVYDPESGVFTNLKRRGSKAAPGDVAGTVNDSGYVLLTYKAVKFRAHRIAWEFVYGKIPDGMLIDHINGEKTDNRISNLRLATKSQNAANSQYSTPRKLKGVHPIRSSKKPYMALIMVKQKQIYLGAFETKNEAALAYDAAAIEHFGEYATLNFPKD